jgi:putative membrane protein
MPKRISFFNHIFDSREDIILRDYLALERTKLANERTLLSYSRTSLYMLLGGIAFLQLQGFIEIRWLGYFAITLSFLLAIFGIIRYLQIRNRLIRYYRRAKSDKMIQDP